ncbi:MAG: hydrogenase/urease maturation nickel metallochaperone HypA [Candidatus Omnitrophota bacterium]
MHESGAIQRIIKVINEKAKGSKVARIHFCYGKLTGFSPEHIAFHLREHTKGTPLENAELDFKEAADPFKDLYVESIEVD